MTTIHYPKTITNTNTHLTIRHGHSRRPSSAAVIAYVGKHTSIPVPKVLWFDATENNVLEREYLLMTLVGGVSVARIYDQVVANKDGMDSVLDQLTGILLELWRIPWAHVGGLLTSSSKSGEAPAPAGAPAAAASFEPGPVVEETFWHVPDVAQYWPATESSDTLNPSSPTGYSSFSAYAAAKMQLYTHMIETHSSLVWLRPHPPLLQAFTQALQDPTSAKVAKVDDAPLRLAHCDLNFGNVLIDPSTFRITAILDWEFAQVVPLPLWNSVRPFLWNPSADAGSNDEKNRLLEVWTQRAAATDEGSRMLRDMQWKWPEQEHVHGALRFVRALCEVCPRGQREEQWESWWASAEKGMVAFTEECDRLRSG